MRVPLVQSIDRIVELSQRSPWGFFESCKKIGSKISGFALDRLGRSSKRSALLPDSTASQVMLDLLASMAVVIRQSATLEDAIKDLHSKKKSKTKKHHKKQPLGLSMLKESAWMNAWLQFFFHLPKISELAYFAPKSLDPLCRFIDQYTKDQEEDREMASADASSVLRCFHQNLCSMSDVTDLHEVFIHFFQSVFPSGAMFNNSVIFRPEWMMIWEGEDLQLFEAKVQKTIEAGPSEILLGIRRKNLTAAPSIPRQLFHPSGKYFYDLDAFIECRRDASGAVFVAYVRTDGSWYQCDDERIRLVSSRNLSVPLCRGVLSHYKRLRV